MGLRKNRKPLPLTEQIAQIKQLRELSPQLYREFTTMLLSNQSLPAEHQQQIILLLDEIKLGLIRITRS